MKQEKKARLFVKPTIAALLIGSTLMVAFQNCSQVNFAEDPESIINAAGSPVDIVCDPFSSQGQCDPNSQDGLLGNVYHLPGERNSVQKYIDTGMKLGVYVQLSNLDIPKRSWSSGFPGPQGLLKDQNGDVLIEYFALDLRGYMSLTPAQDAGEYDFAVASDDGAILDVGGQTIVDHDGQHDRTWKCSSVSVTLQRGQKYPVRLRYYQGPRVEIALQVYMRPVSQRGNGCGDQSGWTIVPREMLHH